MKIINYSLIFSSFFIITACGSNQPSREPVSSDSKEIITLCTAGYETKSSAGLKGKYKDKEAGVSVTRGSSEGGNVTANGFKGEAAVSIYNKYDECIKREKDRKNNNGGYTSTRIQSPDVILNKGNNSPSNVNFNYAA